MKKMLKSKKGFSLVELLIVIAIMGVLAVIAFSMFSGVVANSRKKADNTQAGNIQKALVAYMVDTGDSKLEFLKNDEAVKTGSDWTEVVLALQKSQEVDGEPYEPFLNPKNGSKPSTSEFKTQWNGHYGYKIDVYPERMNAAVVPATVSGEGTLKIHTDESE